jgi:EAL domain-containing protein (putative c-di-GMP-specific phosphodiesterase class I)
MGAAHGLSRSGALAGNVRVAVNVSPLQFANPALAGIVTHAWRRRVDPARLELEITESVFLNDSEAPTRCSRPEADRRASGAR